MNEFISEKSEALELCRAQYLDREKPSSEGEELEILWITEVLDFRRRIYTKEDGTIFGPEDAEKARRWHGTVCRQMADELDNMQKNIIQMIDENFLLIPDDVYDHLKQAEMEMEASKIKLRKRASPSCQTNIKRNLSLITLEFWPVLAKRKFSMKAASRILANAICKAGWSNREPSEISGSLFQTIRNERVALR